MYHADLYVALDLAISWFFSHFLHLFGYLLFCDPCFFFRQDQHVQFEWPVYAGDTLCENCFTEKIIQLNP